AARLSALSSFECLGDPADLRSFPTRRSSDLLAGDPGGVVGGEVGDRGGDVGRVAEPAERVALGDLLFVVGVERGGEGGLDDGGGHRVDPDGRGELIGELLGEVDQGGLARAVDTDARGGVLAGQRGDVDHRAAVLLHPGVVGGGDPGGRGDHVDLEDLGHGGGVDVDDGVEDGVGAGVVDQYVDPAEGLQGAADDLVAVCGVVGLAGDAQGVVGAAEFGDGLLQGLGLAGGDDGAAAFGDDAPGGGQADAAAGSGDDGDFGGETLHWAVLSWRVGVRAVPAPNGTDRPVCGVRLPRPPHRPATRPGGSAAGGSVFGWLSTTSTPTPRPPAARRPSTSSCPTCICGWAPTGASSPPGRPTWAPGCCWSRCRPR